MLLIYILIFFNSQIAFTITAREAKNTKWYVKIFLFLFLFLCWPIVLVDKYLEK